MVMTNMWVLEKHAGKLGKGRRRPIYKRVFQALAQAWQQNHASSGPVPPCLIQGK
jgi:hypothetical protein